MVLDDGTVSVADVEKMNTQHCARLVGLGARGPISAYSRTYPVLLVLRVGLWMDGAPPEPQGRPPMRFFLPAAVGQFKRALPEICEMLP